MNGDKIHVPDGISGTGQEVWEFYAKARSCPECHSIGAPRNGCPHPWHSMGVHPYPETRQCADEVTCVNSCGSGPCSRECRVCRRLAWSGESGPPCPACPDYQAPAAEGQPQCGRWGCVLPPGHNQGQPDIPSNHRNDRHLREGRCPDGGYCHGAHIGGGPPCDTRACFRVLNAGPLSGVFPGDRWPEEIVAAVPPNHIGQAIAMGEEMVRCLRVAKKHGDQDLDATEAHLALAASLAADIIRLAVRRHCELTGKETIKFQGVEYKDQPPG